jgi:hypothetical protein
MQTPREIQTAKQLVPDGGLVPNCEPADDLPSSLLVDDSSSVND